MHSVRLRRRVAPALVLGAIVAATPLVAGSVFDAARGSSRWVAVTVPDTAYPVPNGAIVVANSGRDTNAGTLYAPFATLAHAVSVARAGATIVVRGGTYREPLLVLQRPLTIQSYPHEQVWVKGSVAVTGFAAAGSGTWAHAWRSSLCGTCFPQAVIDPAYPAAGLPDQVFYDGVPLQQVTTRAQVAAGRFFVDRVHGQLVVGSDPTGHVVEVTAQPVAMQVGAGAAGSIVRGIGFAQYGATYGWTAAAMVVVTGRQVAFDHDAMAWSAGRGISVLAPGASITDSVFMYNGLNGIHAHHADGLQVLRTRVAYSNAEHFSTAPSTYAAIAAIKVTSTFDAVVRDDLVDDNDSNGVWFDLSAYNTSIAGTTAVRNNGHGIFYEVSGNATIAGNVVAANAFDGIRLSGATNVAVVWHNTVVDNGGAQLGVYDDPRHQPNARLRALGITWDAANTSIVDNVVAGGPRSTQPLLVSFDATNPKQRTSSTMITADNHNVWARANVATIPYVAQWQATTTRSLRLTTLAAMQASLGREQTSVAADNVPFSALFANPARMRFAPVSGSATSAAGVPLPAGVAALLGVPGGAVVHVGALQAPLV